MSSCDTQTCEKLAAAVDRWLTYLLGDGEGSFEEEAKLIDELKSALASYKAGARS